MFKRLILVSFCLFSILTYSQQRKPHIVKLLPNKDEPIETVDFYITKVVDNRVYKDNIGVAQKGMFNKKVLAKFNKPFEEEILNYVNSIIPVNESKDGFIIRINQLLISENTGAFKETGKAIINLDILKKTGENYFLLGSYSAYKEKNSADVTGKHDDRIRDILIDCLLEFQFHFKFETYKLENRLVTLDMKQKPSLLDGGIDKGFFQTFNELYNNNPFTDASITFKKRDNHIDKLYLEDIEHKKALYYAYYNGESVFLNASSFSGEKHFVRTEMIDRFLLFNDAFIAQDDAMVMSMAFGVLGLLATNKKSHVLLDLYTGQFHVLKDIKIKDMLRHNEALYNLYKSDRNSILVMKDVLEKRFKNDAEELRNILLN